MREQVELCYYIGYAGKVQAAFEAACIAAATCLCGGCFVAEGTGWWRDGAGCRAPRFHGRLEAERTLCIRLTCELPKEDEVTSEMRATIAAAVRAHAMSGRVRWVHVQRHKVQGLHFPVEEGLAEAA